MRHHEDMMAIVECYIGEQKALALNEAQIGEAQEYLNEAKEVRARYRERLAAAASLYVKASDTLDDIISEAPEIARSVSEYVLGFRITADDIRSVAEKAWRLKQFYVRHGHMP
jgi:hypothetical protein